MDKKATILGILMIGGVSSAYGAADKGSVYVGAKVGWSAYHQTKYNNDSVNNEDVKKDKFSYGAYAGYQVLDNLAFEAAYDELGKIEYKKQNSTQRDASYQVRGGQLTAKISLPITDTFDVYTRLGTFVYQGKAKLGSKEMKRVGVSPVIAAGMEVELTENVATRLDYQWIENVGKSSGVKIKPDNGTLSLGLAYRFDQKGHLPQAESATEIPPAEEIVRPTPPEKRNEVRGPIRISYENKVVKLNTEVLFEFNQTRLTSTGRDVLNRLIEEMQTFHFDDGTAFLIGYTDRLGGTNYNNNLSKKRSETVKRYLINKGIPESKISTVGRGSDNSRSSCDTGLSRAELIECLANDRRVEIEISGMSSEQETAGYSASMEEAIDK